MRSGPGAARTILLFHIISARPSKQPLMVRTFLKVYMELGSYFLFLQEQIKDIIITKVKATTEAKQQGSGCLTNGSQPQAHRRKHRRGDVGRNLLLVARAHDHGGRDQQKLVVH